MGISDKRIERFVRAGLRAADWYVNSQCIMRKPYWDANHGRFIYTRHIPSGRTVLGIGWTQGRGIFVLLAAWELTRDERYLRSALLAAEYIKILQIYDCPDNPRRQYAIREEVPQSWYSNTRDAVEAALGLLYLYRVTGQDDLLRRVVDFEKWFQANAWSRSGWPVGHVFLDRPKRVGSVASFQAADGALFHYLAQATERKRYRTCQMHLAGETIRRFIRSDGAIVTKTLHAHHTGPGGEVLNDDGLMVSLLAAHVASGRRKYLDACGRHAGWIVENVTAAPKLLSALPCMCTFMIELSAVTGDPGYREWAARMLQKHVLALQVRKRSDPMIDGAFRGEDEPVEYYGPASARKTDFVTTRVTCYSALACFKLAGIVGPYYGALGWDRRVRKPKLPRLALD